MRPPIATVFLVVLILSTYFILSNGNPYMEEQQLRNTALKATSFPLSLVTQLFTHVGLLHLLGNLLPLLAFGVIVENRLRSYDVIAIFLCAGTIAGCVFALLSPQTMLAGASSGITGLIGAAILLHPKAATAALIAVPLLSSAIIFPLTAYAVQQHQLGLTNQNSALQEKYAVFVSENKTAEAAQVREESVQVMQAIDVQEKGRLREQAAPVDLSVHVCGIVFGLAYVLLLKPKQRDRGFREYSSFAKSTLELFSRLVGSRNKKRRAQKQ